MRATGVLWIVGVLALGACADDWHNGPVSFSHDGKLWELQKIRLDLSGTWVDAPAGLDPAQMRYYATRAFEAYAGCPVAPNSIDIAGNAAVAQMRC